MWNTVLGKRTLSGAEAELFRFTAALFLETMMTDLESEDGASHHCGFAAFDSLSPGQQIVVFQEVCEGLLVPKRKPPELYAANEALIAAIFYEIKVIHEEDQLCDDDHEIQRVMPLLINAAKQHDILSLERITPPYDNEIDLLIECLMNTILWDDDYQDFGVLDQPPDQAEFTKEMMSIPSNYYTATPDDLNNEKMHKTAAEVRRLLLRGVLPENG